MMGDKIAFSILSDLSLWLFILLLWWLALRGLNWISMPKNRRAKVSRDDALVTNAIGAMAIAILLVLELFIPAFNYAKDEVLEVVGRRTVISGNDKVIHGSAFYYGFEDQP